MEFKQFNHEIKGVDETSGVIEAYANVYNNIDSDDDISMPGAFTKTVSENFKRIRVLRNHNPTERLGIAKEINASDPYGLFTVTQFNMNKALSRDMFFDNKMALDNGQNAELSIGVIAKNYNDEEMNGRRIRKISEWQLMEYSFLDSWAANEFAIVTQIKSATDNGKIISMLTKAYNLPYSDLRLVEIEKILNSLNKEPSDSITLNTEPNIYNGLISYLEKN